MLAAWATQQKSRRAVRANFSTNTVKYTVLNIVNRFKTPQGHSVQIQGPLGVIEITDLVWVTDRQDFLETLYYCADSVLQGAYHCCLSLPGRVKLIS
jgi:hypothetical protein